MNTTTARLLVRSVAVAGLAAACAVLGSGFASAAVPADAPLVMTLAPDNGGPSLTLPIAATDTRVTVTPGSNGRFDLSADRADLNDYTEVDNETGMGFTVTVTDSGVTRDDIPLGVQANLFFRP